MVIFRGSPAGCHFPRADVSLEPTIQCFARLHAAHSHASSKHPARVRSHLEGDRHTAHDCSTLCIERCLRLFGVVESIICQVGCVASTCGGDCCLGFYVYAGWRSSLASSCPGSSKETAFSMPLAGRSPVRPCCLQTFQEVSLNTAV